MKNKKPSLLSLNWVMMHQGGELNRFWSERTIYLLVLFGIGTTLTRQVILIMDGWLEEALHNDPATLHTSYLDGILIIRAQRSQEN